VLVHPVGFLDLDVDESCVDERLLELGLGERAGYAACPLHHVRTCRHVVVGDDVGDREATAGA